MRWPLRAPQSLMGRITLATGLIAMIAVGALVWRSDARVRGVVQRGERGRLQAIAATLSVNLRGDVHRNTLAALPDKDSFFRWSDAPPALNALHQTLETVARANNVVTGIDTLALRRPRIIAEDPESEHEDAMMVVATSNDPPYYRHSTAYVPAMGAALEGQVSLDGPFEDDHGTWIAAYAPVRGSDGEVDAIIVLRSSLDQRFEELDLESGEYLGYALLILVIVISGLIVATAQQTNSMSALARAARRFARGDLETSFQTEDTLRSRGAREVRALAETLEGARQKLSAELEARQEQQQKLADALEGAQAATKVKSQFLANMSHELRTPMNAIIGYAEMLIEDAEHHGALDMETAVADLHRIKGSATHLLALINDILDLSKIEAGKMLVYPEEVDVIALAQECSATVRPLARERNNTLRLDINGSDEMMYTDLTRLRQILLNLLSNAAKFTKDGELRLALHLGESQVRIVVQDSGIGMTEAQLEGLFVPFTQADASTTRRFGGTGLGLALCKEFVDLLGGSITAQSRINEGSRFEVRLPRELQTPTAEG